MKKYKDIITSYLKNHEEHRIAAADIYEHLREHECDVNKTTVYRNLDKLEAEGVLKKYKLPDEAISYYRYVDPSCNHHLHMQCKRCGKIFHLNCEFMDEITEHLLKDHGFLLDCSDSLLVGLCEDCRKEMSK